MAVSDSFYLSAETQYLYMRWIPFQTPPPFTFGGRAKFFQIFLTTKNTLKI